MSKSMVIPQGEKGSKERKDYAKKLKDVATSIYYNGRWKRHSDKDSVLVEVWQRPRGILIHPSRSRYFPVDNQAQKRKLHALVQENKKKMLMFESAAYAGAKRAKKDSEEEKKYKKISHPKDKKTPPWAQKANDIIGYTSRRKIHFAQSTLGISLGSDLRSFPSIYYKRGHVTIDHNRLGNIGYEEGGQRCLFFGNVPKKYVR